jgi:photosystem II stability/assembly factor-like uncharacterized protein
MKAIFFVFFSVLCVTLTSSAQWIPQKSNVNVDLIGVRFTSSLKGWVVGQNGTILKTTDGGASWSQISSPAYSILDKVSFADSANGWVVGDHNTILSTTDGGASWQQDYNSSPYPSLVNYYGIFCANFNGQNLRWLAGGNRSANQTEIERSSVPGQWQPAIIGFDGRLAGIYFINANVGWAVGDSLILSTTNGGKWWNNQATSPTESYLNSVAFFDSLTGISVGQAIIIKSTDSGTHWRVIQSNPIGNYFKVILLRDSVAYIAGYYGGTAAILRSTDRGETWVNQNVNQPSGTWLEDIYFLNDSVGWAVGANGIILHTTNRGMGSLLPTPIASAPTTGDTLAAKDTALVWYSAAGAASYEVQIASDSAFSSIVVDSAKITDTSLALQEIIGTKLTGKTKYFWHLKAVSDTATSSFSITWSFITPTLSLMKDDKDGIPKSFELGQNYPNPFNPATVITYGLPRNSFVKLSIYDDLGREVKVLVNSQENAGSYSVNFDANNLPSGVYFYRIEAGNYSDTKKLILIK